jgi:capsular exopolysaccharide synthesis family protein
MPPQTGSHEADAFDLPQGPAFPSLLRIAWKRKWLVLFAVAVCLALGGLYCAQAPPVYQSSTQVWVVRKRPDAPLPGVDPRLALVEDYLATHLVLIRSPWIVGQAIEKANLRSLPSFQDEEDVPGAIIRALKSNREPSKDGTAPNNILNLSFRGPDPEACRIVVIAVLQSYKDALDATYRNVSDDTVQRITQARDDLLARLGQKREDYADFRLKHPLMSKARKGKEGLDPLQERIFTIEARRAVLLVQQTEVEGLLAAFDRAFKQGRSRAELLAMVPESSRRFGSESLQSNLGASPRHEVTASEEGKMKAKATTEDPLVALHLQEQMLLQEYGPGHPQVRAIHKRMEGLRAQNKQATQEASPDNMSPENDRDPLLPVLAHVQSLKRELHTVKTSEQALARLLEKEQAEAAKLVSYEIQDEKYRADIEGSKQLFDAVVKRVDEANLLKQFGGFSAQSISPPGPGVKVAPKLALVLPVAGLVGLLLGFGLAYVSDLTDHSFRTPDEIRRRLKLPVVGHIPLIPSKYRGVRGGAAADRGLDRILCTLYRPKSREAEAYRGVRTAVYFGARGEGHKIIQITSPDMGDGKTTLAANLAVSMAQTGQRVILIDADFRRPRLHALFGLEPGGGLVSVLAGDAELADAAFESGIPGLAVLPCGPVPSNPAELLTLPRFKQMLDYLRQAYDFVLVDTPPLLAVTDPCVVAPQMDGVLLTIRLSKNARPHAERAREILATLGANVIGVVVNGMARKGGGAYAYDSDRYAYGYASDGYCTADESGLPQPDAAVAVPSRAKDANGDDVLT